MKKNVKFVLWVVLIVVQHLLNNTSGSAQSNVCFTSAFDNTYTLTNGTWPHSMVSADFNSDGKLDLIITNTPSANLSLLLGDGNGKFLEAPAIEVGSEPTGVTAADFNDDGKIDIAFADQDVNLVFILLGNGNGTFQTPTGFFVGARPLAIVAADFNNDGNTDLATANQAGNNISVSLGNGDGTFPDATFIGEGITHYSIAAGDFNDDGIIDLATANRDEVNFTDGNISVFTADGSGGFLARVDYTAGLHPTFVTSADLNQDGRSDLIAANSGSQNISVLLAKTSGGFNAPANYSIIGQPDHITSSDFDGDGFKDLAVVDVQSSNIVVFSGSASGSLTWRENYAAGGPGGFIISPDINNDAVPDLVLLKREAHSIGIWLGKPGNFFDGIKTNQVGFYPGALVTADFNLDGKKDIATPNYYGDNVSVLLANSTGTLDVAINSAAGTTPNSIAVSDFNSDGKLDIVACNYDVDQVSLIIGNGDGSFGAPVSYSVGSKPQGIVSADFNGDNKMDVAVVNSHDNNISILYGDGTGGLASETIVTAGPSISGFASADFNKDGKFDLAVLDWTESNLTLMLGNGIGNFIQGPKYPVGTNPSGILTADMDSDGIMDLVVNGHNYQISILSGTGTGTLSPRVDYSANIPYAVTVGDFNKDSKLDIAYNSLGNGLGILLAKPTSGFFPAIFSNSEQGSLASIDVNNDGLTDLAGIISSSVVVLYNNTAVIAAGGPTSFCSGNSVVLSATANGYTYQWNSGGSTARDLTATTGGSYNVTITNQNGSCSSTSNTILVSIPPPSPIVTKVHPKCDGIKGSITVNIRNATDTYSFDNGLTFQSSNVKPDLTPGSYSVIIREATGCRSLPASVTLEAPIEPTEPQVNSSYFFCSESPASIFITQQNFDETYSVDFGNTFQSDNIFHGLSARTYEVVIKSRSGCVSPTKFVHINSLAPGVPDASVVQPTCHTPTGSISVVVKNWGDTYSFDDGATFQSGSMKEGLIPGIYSVRVRTFSPCVSDPIAVEIIAPPPVPSQPLIITTQPSCTVSTGSASVEVQQATDVYSFDNGITFQSSPLMSGLPPGLHQVVTRNSVGCVSIASDVVLSNPPATPLQPVVTVAQPTCDAAGSITVTEQTAGETYSFDNGVSFQTSNAKTLVAGTYQVVIQSIGECSSLPTSAIILDAPATPSVPLLTLTQPTCEVSEGSATVAVQDLDDSYSFDGGTTFQSSSTKHGLIPGNYNVVIHRNDGCTSVGATAIINQQPAKPTTPVITFDSSDPSQPLMISSSGPIFKWFKDGILITDQVSSNLIVISVGSYFVVAVNAEGCESEASDPVEVTITSVEENSDSFQLYPNPTEDQISFNLIGFTLGKEIDITIVNTSGVVVRHQTIIADETTAINVAQLAQGEYIILLKQSEKTSTKSFIKK